MTQGAVTRAMLMLTATLTAAAVAFGCLVNRPPAAAPQSAAPGASAEGASLFESYCAGCHTEQEAVQFLRAAPNLEAGRRDLSALLAGHGDSSAAEDAAIVAFLVGRARD